MKSKSSIFILLIVLATLIGVVGGFFISKAISENKIKDMQQKLDWYELRFDTKENCILEPENHLCRIDLKKDTNISQKLNDNFEISFRETEGKPSEDKTLEEKKWDVYVNGKKICSDSGTMNRLNEDYVEVHYTDQYVLYEPFCGKNYTATRSLIVVDAQGNIVKEIKDFEDPEMEISNIEYKENGIVITTDRYIWGSPFNVANLKYEQISDIPADSQCINKYVYKIDNNGNIDLEKPQKTVMVTFMDQVKEYFNKCENQEVKEVLNKYIEEHKKLNSNQPASELNKTVSNTDDNLTKAKKIVEELVNAVNNKDAIALERLVGQDADTFSKYGIYQYSVNPAEYEVHENKYVFREEYSWDKTKLTSPKDVSLGKLLVIEFTENGEVRADPFCTGI